MSSHDVIIQSRADNGPACQRPKVSVAQNEIEYSRKINVAVFPSLLWSQGPAL